METYWLELGIGVLCVLWWLYSWTVERRLDTMRERYFEMVDCQQQLRDRLLALEHPPLRRRQKQAEELYSMEKSGHGTLEACAVCNPCGLMAGSLTGDTGTAANSLIHILDTSNM